MKWQDSKMALDSKLLNLESKTFLDSAQGLPGILGFEMRNRCFQARGEGSYLSGNDQAPSIESTIYRSKPNAQNTES